MQVSAITMEMTASKHAYFETTFGSVGKEAATEDVYSEPLSSEGCVDGVAHSQSTSPSSQNQKKIVKRHTKKLFVVVVDILRYATHHYHLQEVQNMQEGLCSIYSARTAFQACYHGDMAGNAFSATAQS